MSITCYKTKGYWYYQLVCSGTIEKMESEKQILKKTLSRMIISKQGPLKIFRNEDIRKTFDVQERTLILLLRKKIINTQLSNSGQNKMFSNLKHQLNSSELKVYIHNVSSHIKLVSAIDDLKSRGQWESRFPSRNPRSILKEISPEVQQKHY